MRLRHRARECVAGGAAGCSDRPRGSPSDPAAPTAARFRPRFLPPTWRRQPQRISNMTRGEW